MGNLLSNSTPKNPDLPEDVVFTRILPRLPVTSLMRFKLVSKKWFDLITGDSDFVSAHLRHHSESTKLPIILAKHAVWKKKRMRIFLLSDELKTMESFSSHLAKSVPLSLEETKIVGSCNGLVCISISHIGKDLILWNPETREFRHLPVRMLVRYTKHVALGFGFDEKAKDYKLLSIVEMIPGLLHLQLFTVGSNSWMLVKLLSGYLLHTQNSVLQINGVFYWLAYKGSVSGINSRVLSFNLLDEEAREIVDLPAVYKPRYDRFRLTKWKENSLALLALEEQFSSNKCDFWLLGNDENNGPYWTMMFRVNPLKVWNFCGVWRGQLLIDESHLGQRFGSSAHRLILFDPLSKKATKSPKTIKKSESSWLFYEAHDYVPSLVSVYPNRKA